jgi:hypothetical protein
MPEGASMSLGPKFWSAIAACTAMAISGVAFATPPSPFAKGDSDLGRPINERDCVACQARGSRGDNDRGYGRSDPRARAPDPVLAHLDYCQGDLAAGRFPGEEEHISAYLHKQYYRFE